nr:RecName: Full=Uncharacterized protein IMPP1 [Nautilus macromphalus]
FVSTYK